MPHRDLIRSVAETVSQSQPYKDYIKQVFDGVRAEVGDLGQEDAQDVISEAAKVWRNRGPHDETIRQGQFNSGF